MIASLFDMARVSVEVMVLLFGTLTLWLGFLRAPRARAWWNGWRGCSARCSRA